MSRTLAMAFYVSLISLMTAWISQPSVTLNGGLGWDGINYASMYERFIYGVSQLQLISPFHQRIAMPYLASIIPLEPRTAFFVLHSFFWLGSMAFFVLICRQRFRVPDSLTMLAVFWLQIHWIAVPRAGASYSFGVDSSAIFFISALTYLFALRQTGIAIIVTACIGTFFKETILLWCICRVVLTIKNS